MLHYFAAKPTYHRRYRVHGFRADNKQSNKQLNSRAGVEHDDNKTTHALRVVGCNARTYVNSCTSSNQCHDVIDT